MAFRLFARLLSAATLFLILAGALVTSTGSGLSVPDWPTSYGYNMFTFPLHLMVGGIIFEHGHRLVASTVGFLTIVLAAWLWWRDDRRWLRWFGVAALGVVILQGVLGGLTVLMKLPAPISIGHAGLAQIFFCMMIAITVFSSKTWPTH
jgi:cytochrome c oxidase assembly protein subunit 15